VLKKAGIVVAAIGASLIAISPLAYAGGGDEWQVDGADPEQVVDTGADTQEGLVNIGDINILNGVNVCPDVTAALGIGNVLGLLGTGSADPSATGGQITCENEATADPGAGGQG
jgi:hypothetical protein